MQTLIQTPEQKPKVQKPALNDRTGVWENRTKFNQEQARIINDGIYWMEQEIWREELENEQTTPHQKVRSLFWILLYLKNSFPSFKALKTMWN